MEWRPIETARKDEDEKILVCDNKGWVGQVYWMDSWYGDNSKPGWMIANCDEEYGFYIDATHWMPLPKAPE